MKKTIASLLAATTLAAAVVPVFATDVATQWVEENYDNHDGAEMQRTDANGPGLSAVTFDKNGIAHEGVYVEDIENKEIPVTYTPEVVAVEVRLDANGNQVETPIYSKAPERIEGTTASDAAKDPNAPVAETPAEKAPAEKTVAAPAPAAKPAAETAPAAKKAHASVAAAKTAVGQKALPKTSAASK